VAKIFDAKGRPQDHPLIVHLAGIELLPQWARDIPAAVHQLAEAFWPGPLTLILKRADGVPAHELAHVMHRHGIQQLIGTVGVAVIANALLGDSSGLLARLAGRSTVLLNLKYSRDHEREADLSAWDYLIDAGIDPEGMITFFDRLLQMRKGSALDDIGGALSFLSTHPGMEERLDTLRRKRADLPTDRDFAKFAAELEYDEFKDIVRNAGTGGEPSQTENGD